MAQGRVARDDTAFQTAGTLSGEDVEMSHAPGHGSVLRVLQVRDSRVSVKIGASGDCRTFLPG